MTKKLGLPNELYVIFMSDFMEESDKIMDEIARRKYLISHKREDDDIDWNAVFEEWDDE